LLARSEPVPKLKGVTVMPFIIQNRSDDLLVIQLNTGRAVHLAPGGSSEVGDLEISGNEKINKLTRAKIIAVEEATEAVAEESSKKPEKKSGKGPE
jgi:hypothetical protein